MDGIRTAALGGFSGSDPLLSLDQFIKMSGEGNIVYFMNTNVSRPRRQIRNLNQPKNQVIVDYIRGNWIDYSQKLKLPNNTVFKNPYSR